jgi:hypothetical protein
VSARWLALVVVLTLLPAVELVEQGAHVVEHVLVGSATSTAARSSCTCAVGTTGSG